MRHAVRIKIYTCIPTVNLSFSEIMQTSSPHPTIFTHRLQKQKTVAPTTKPAPQSHPTTIFSSTLHRYRSPKKKNRCAAQSQQSALIFQAIARAPSRIPVTSQKKKKKKKKISLSPVIFILTIYPTRVRLSRNFHNIP